MNDDHKACQTSYWYSIEEDIEDMRRRLARAQAELAASEERVRIAVGVADRLRREKSARLTH